VKSGDVLDEEIQLDVHHAFGMEQHTDYVFKPRGDREYSATIVLEETGPVIARIIEESKGFTGSVFIIDDLDMEANKIERYHVKEGYVKERLRSGWKWE